MTAWTDPQYVASGTASSAQFNAETVDNLKHLHERAPRTLKLLGTMNMASGTANVAFTSVTVVVDDSLIPYSLSSGALTLIEGGFFLVTVEGIFPTNTNGTIRQVLARGNTLGVITGPAQLPNGVGPSRPAGAMPADIPPGEVLTLEGRQNSGVALNPVDALLGIVYLGPT